MIIGKAPFQEESLNRLTLLRFGHLRSLSNIELLRSMNRRKTANVIPVECTACSSCSRGVRQGGFPS